MHGLMRRAAVAALLVLSGQGGAEDQVKLRKSAEFVPLFDGKPYLYVVHEGRSIKVQRVQDPDYELKGYFAKTVRKCPPFCLQPVTPDASVQVIGEIELFEFMETALRDGNGVLIDARTASWHRKGTIPGSVNYPFTLFGKGKDSLEVAEMFKQFGVVKRGEIGMFEQLLEDWGWSDNRYKTADWDFTDAKDLVVWCNGPSCGQSPRAIHGLLDAGYPGDRIKYYRGGMQMWNLWGLTTVVPRK